MYSQPHFESCLQFINSQTWEYFSEDLENPLSYHLVINTDSMPYEKAVRLIGEAALDFLKARTNSRLQEFMAKTATASP
jgi:hypothetical protein